MDSINLRGILALLFVIVGWTGLWADEPAFSVSASATLTKNHAAQFYAGEFDLGILPLGKSGKVVLEVKNPFDKTLEFSKITKTCNCMDLKSLSDKLEILPNSSHKFSMTLTTPISARSSRLFSQVVLHAPGDDKEGGETKEIAIFRFSYGLAGVLSINKNYHVCEIHENSEFGRVTVPVLITDPVKAQNLNVQLSQSLRDLSFQIETRGNEVFVFAEIPAVTVKEGSISGEVRVVDKTTERRDGFFLTVKQGSDVRISPTVLRFKIDPENENRITASAILRRTLPVQDFEEQDRRASDNAALSPGHSEERVKSNADFRETKDAPTVAARIGGQPADVTVRRLSDHIFRVAISIEKDMDLNQGRGIEWKVKFGSKSTDVQSSFVVIN